MKYNCLLAITVCASITSHAGTMGGQTNPAHSGGWVLGADIGYGYLNTQEEDILAPAPITIPASTETQEQSHSIGSLVGGGYLGYNFEVLSSLLMGTEVGYKYLGQSRYRSFVRDVISNSFFNNDIKINQQTIDLLLTGRFYVWQELSFIGKVGAAYVRSETNSKSNFNLPPFVGGLPTDAVIWRIKPEFSVGVGYPVANNTNLNLTYTHIGGVDSNVTGLFRYYSATPDRLPAVFEYNGITLGLSYTF